MMMQIDAVTAARLDRLAAELADEAAGWEDEEHAEAAAAVEALYCAR